MPPLSAGRVVYNDKEEKEKTPASTRSYREPCNPPDRYQKGSVAKRVGSLNASFARHWRVSK